MFSVMNLGIIDTIMSWLMNLFSTGLLLAVNLIYAIFSKLLFLIGAAFANIADFFQAVFRALAGIGTPGYNKVLQMEFTEQVAQDPILRVITSEVVINLFISMMVLAIGIVIVSTIVAMIRQEYATDGGDKNSKSEILGKAVKAFANFVIVPVACVVGILLANTLLRWVDYATANGNDTTIGAQVFYASAYNANKMRSSGHKSSQLVSLEGTIFENFDLTAFIYNPSGGAGQYFTSDEQSPNTGWSNSIYSNGQTIGNNNMTCNEIANLIDQAFLNFDEIIENDQDHDLGFGATYFDYKYQDTVDEYYNLGAINYIIFIAGEVAVMWMMLNMTLGMMKRIYLAAIYFVIGPPIIGLTPIKDGLSKWRGDFINNVLSAFAPVVGLNIFFQILPAINTINIFASNQSSYNAIIHMLFAIVGLMVLNEMSKAISSLLGTGDALETGKGMSKQVAAGAAKVGAVALGLGGATIKGVSMANKLRQSMSNSMAAGKANNLDAGELDTYRKEEAVSKKYAGQKVGDIVSDYSKDRAEFNKTYGGTTAERDAKEKAAQASMSADDFKAWKEERDNKRKDLDTRKDDLDIIRKGAYFQRDAKSGQFTRNKSAENAKKLKKLSNRLDNNDIVETVDSSGKKTYESNLQNRWHQFTKNPGAVGGWITDKGKSLLGGLRESTVGRLNEGIDSSINMLGEAAHFDMKKARSKAAQGKGKILERVLGGVGNKLAEPIDFTGPTGSQAAAARFSAAQQALSGVDTKAFAKAFLDKMYSALKSKDINANKLGMKMAKQAGIKLDKTTIDDIKNGSIAKGKFTDDENRQRAVINAATLHMSAGKTHMDSELLAQLERNSDHVVSKFVHELRELSKSTKDSNKKIIDASKSDNQKLIDKLDELVKLSRDDKKKP